MKLFVQSTINIDEDELLKYAEMVSETALGMKPKDFVEQVKRGYKVCVEFPDKTVSTYEIIVEN